MSDRHMHITSFLHETQERVDAFVRAARELPGAFFWFVSPVVNDHGRTIAVALFSKDMDGLSDEMEMPQVAQVLSGIMEYDIEIVSAWEGGDRRRSLDRSTPRGRVWRVAGCRSLPGHVLQGVVVHRPIGQSTASSDGNRV